jgi:hypothetical protein
MLCLVKSHTVFSQRKYYEYNNPDALKLTKARIQMLTSGEWIGSKLEVDIPSNNFGFRNRHKITYRPDKTYLAEGLSGNWKIKYDQYLIHTATTTKRGQHHPFVGIYSVTALNDSTLTLVKLHSSSSDMARILSFRNCKHPNVKKSISSINLPYESIQTSALDSIRYLTVEDLFMNNIFVEDDTARIPTRDTIYTIKMNLGDPFRKVKVFQQDEPVNFYLLTSRHSVPVDKIKTIDSLAIDFIKKNTQLHHGANEIDSTNPYFRQYVGYSDRNGHNIIYLNAFSDYHSNWKSELIRPPVTGSKHFFSVYVNLTTRECFGLHVNGN